MLVSALRHYKNKKTGWNLQMTGCIDDNACNLAAFSLLKNGQICLIYKQHLHKSFQASIFIAKKKKKLLTNVILMYLFKY